MAYLPYSPQIGAKYVIVSPTGVRAAFNDPTDPDYVGVLSEIAGLDSAEVREAAEDLASADGGQHGQFWYGRRVITMTGTVFGHASMQERDIRLDKLRRATDAMRGDAKLYWQNLPLGSNAPMFTSVRRQTRLQISGAWVKEFQVALVSEFAPLYGQTLKTRTGNPLTAENQGDYPSNPLITLTGATSATEVVNDNGANVLRFASGVGPGNLAVNTENHTATMDGTPANQLINFSTTIWPTVKSGMNNFRLQGGPGTLQVQWYDTWT